MAFTPINTEEEFQARFNESIKDRLAQQERKIRGEYADYEDLKKQSASWTKEKEGYEKTIADNKTAYEELEGKYTEAVKKNTEYETDALKTRIAIESKLPLELRGYLKGNTEEEIKASASELGKFAAKKTAPMADLDDEPPKDKKQQSMKEMLKAIKGES